jgi:hypothetical protein
MTLDDQLRALAPLDAGVVARLAGYSAGPAQLRLIRLRGSRMPEQRIDALIASLEAVTEVARGLKARATTPARQRP